MTNQLSTIQFYGQPLITIEQDGKYYVAMRPICENIGLDWGGQYTRIKRDEVLRQGVVVIPTPSNGGSQQMLCLPIEYLNGWLFGIDATRVKPGIKDKLIRYKKECYQVLHNYWHKGNYINSQLPWIKDEALEALFSFLFLAHSQAVVLKHLYPAVPKNLPKFTHRQI